MIICSCIHGCFHAILFESLLARQAECEALRAEALKWEGEAESQSSMQDVSTLNFICSSVISPIVSKQVMQFSNTVALHVCVHRY